VGGPIRSPAQSGALTSGPSGQAFGESHASITVAQATMAVLVTLLIAGLVVLVR